MLDPQATLLRALMPTCGAARPRPPYFCIKSNILIDVRLSDGEVRLADCVKDRVVWLDELQAAVALGAVLGESWHDGSPKAAFDCLHAGSRLAFIMAPLGHPGSVSPGGGQGSGRPIPG